MRALPLFMGVILGLGSSAAAAADPVRVELRLVRDESSGGGTLAGVPVRVVVGNGAALRKADAGTNFITGGDGGIGFDTDAPVIERSIQLDNVLAWHKARFVEVGIELDLVGKRALYVAQLDLVREGTVGVLTANLQGDGGNFDAPLVFHPNTHSWSFPGEPNGFHLTDIGAELLAHDLEGSPGGPWTVRLTVSKQEFTVR